MANQHGDFIWYELLTTDPDAAAEFYGAILGWECQGANQPGMDYRQFTRGDRAAGGLMKLPPGAGESGMGAVWLGYIAVNDVDQAVASIVNAGGTQHMPATDIPGVGRFAFLSDPQGGLFYVMRGASDQTSTVFSVSETGLCNWNELATDDLAAALDFYGQQFGWSKGDAMDMGDMGPYQFITQNSVTIGAMMKRLPESPPTLWTFYFRVDDIDAAVKLVTANGGQVIHGPSEVPGGEYIINGIDPQGALFALVGKRRA